MSKFLDYTGLEHYNDKVQGQISQLGQELLGKNEALSVADWQHATIQNNLAIQASENYRVSPAIELKSGDTLVVETSGINPLWTIIKCSQDGTPISGLVQLQGDNDTIDTYTYQASEDMYVRISVRIVLSGYSVTHKRDGAIVILDKELRKLIDVRVGENTEKFAVSTTYSWQNRAYVYGNYKAGDKLIIRVFGSAITADNTISIRYDDESTQIATLTNNHQKEVTLARDTYFIVGIVSNSNITTPGTISLSVIGSVSKDVLEIKSDGYVMPGLINTAVASKTFRLSGTKETPTQTYTGYILSYPNRGALTQVSGQNQFIVEEYSVNPFSTYRILASKRYNHCVYALLDVTGSVIQYVGSGDNTNQRLDELIVMPIDAAKIHVAYDNTLNVGGLFVPAIEPISGTFGKKWIAIGDSLTEVNSKATKNYLSYIADKTGLVPVNMGLSGSGYRMKYDTNQAFYQRVSNIVTDGDLITIFGSFNDLSVDGYDLGTPTDTGTTTICGCINNTIDTILSVYLTAGKLPVIGVITPTPWGSYMPSSPTSAASNYCDAIIECCKRKSIPVLDLYRCSNLHPDNATFRTLAYSRDGGNSVHPDENGHKIIAPIIQEFIEQLIR